jgi:hypothetical protein
MDMQGRRIQYSSTIRGAAQVENGRETVYHGLASIIPVAEYLEKLEEYGDRDLQAIQAFIDSLPDDQEVGEPWERHEAYDIETDSILVLWRIPVHEKLAAGHRDTVTEIRRLIAQNAQQGLNVILL